MALEVGKAVPAWPVPWGQQAGDGDALGGPKRRSWPPADWPSHTQLTYTKELITVLLLVLALPWLVSKLITRPADVLVGLGQKATGRAASG